jgi:GNAT superfamily N-acetyltransferase
MQIALANSLEELTACHPVMRQLRTHLDQSAFLNNVKRMRMDGYRLVYLADPDVRAVAGYRKMELLATGTILYVDDLVTASEFRSRGYGRHLLAWLFEEARRLDCQYLELDSGLQRLDAHRFYEREGMKKTAFHFSIPANAANPWSETV